MRILIVGAGAIGGYFGARLLEAGRDVTFLVRPSRAAALAQHGLIVRSPRGDVNLSHPPCVVTGQLKTTFDAILLSCKAYDLPDAIEAIAPAVSAQTMIVPLLNGMQHLDALAARFDKANLLGGLCFISVDRDEQGAVIHYNNTDTLMFGELDGSASERAQQLAAVLMDAGFDARLSASPNPNILHEMWEKWVFIAAAAGMTCLMRSAVGDYVAAGGAELAQRLIDECYAIAAHNGHPAREPAVTRAQKMLAAEGSPFMASMLRDVERGAPTEAEHLLGDLWRRRPPQNGATMIDERSVLYLAYTHLKAYEARRLRIKHAAP
ncbi:MAG: ketopantoate reductase family protein [Burkholderiales bacterium]|jgi:2-dehydropantoate 2-reductase|nr:ketopantoate reductase family protein [Burkholderiales bacterium]